MNYAELTKFRLKTRQQVGMCHGCIKQAEFEIADAESTVSVPCCSNTVCIDAAHERAKALYNAQALLGNTLAALRRENAELRAELAVMKAQAAEKKH